MLSEIDSEILKEWADDVHALEAKLAEAKAGRDAGILTALDIGAGVAEIVRLTGLTRARIYQIKHGD